MPGFIDVDKAITVSPLMFYCRIYVVSCSTHKNHYAALLLYIILLLSDGLD